MGNFHLTLNKNYCTYALQGMGGSYSTSLENHVNLAFDVAGNVSTGTTSLRWLINVFSVSFWMCILSLGALSDAPFFQAVAHEAIGGGKRNFQEETDDGTCDGLFFLCRRCCR